MPLLYFFTTLSYLLIVTNGFALLPSPRTSDVRLSQRTRVSEPYSSLGYTKDDNEISIPFNETVKEIDSKKEPLSGVDHKHHHQDSSSLVFDDDDSVDDYCMSIVSSEQKLQQWLKDENLASASSTGLPLDIVMERTWDTMEDVMVHLRRKDFEDGKLKLSPEQEQKRKTVVVLGSGWAAHALMKVADCSKLRLIVVSPTNHFVFTPMLASSAVGTVEYRSMTEAVRSANPLIDDYLEGKATGVDVNKKTVTVKLNSLLNGIREGESPTITLPYDHLVCSVGCRVNDRGVPGAEKALRLKTLDDARILRRSVAECFEYASRPDVARDPEERARRATFLIVGGGPTGVELGGELLDLAKDITRPYKGSYPKLKEDIRVVVAHGGPELVPQFEQDLRREAIKSLEKKGATVYLNTRVTQVGDGFANLSTKVLNETTGEEIGREEFTLPVGLTVWCAGVAPVSFTETLLQQLHESARNRDGRINVDKWLRPPMPREDLLGSVLVLGDAAAFPNGGGKNSEISTNSFLPQTAQVAGQQGAFVARMLDRGYNLTVTPPSLLTKTENPTSSIEAFDDPMMRTWLDLRGLEQAPHFMFLNLGILAYLGGGEGKFFSFAVCLLLACTLFLHCVFVLCSSESSATWRRSLIFILWQCRLRSMAFCLSCQTSRYSK